MQGHYLKRRNDFSEITARQCSSQFSYLLQHIQISERFEGDSKDEIKERFWSQRLISKSRVKSLRLRNEGEPGVNTESFW